MIDYIQIILILWLIERVSIERNRYKLAIDTNNRFISDGYWSIWFYCKGINEREWSRCGGRRLMYFSNYIVPHINWK
jgi:hypothetical protein